MSIKSADIKKLSELDFSQLCIPEYQRPYVWSLKETRQLWDDILTAQEKRKSDYRIGTIILHNNDEVSTIDIVDGQQRLTTLSIIIHLLSSGKDGLSVGEFLNKKQFLHTVSVENIKNNAAELNLWISDEITDKELLLIYVMHSCSIVEITVDNISEAFQMFDSQNGRGLSLQPYNLLKAYHIYYLRNESEDIKIKYDNNWESAARNLKRKDYLKQVFDEHLYRVRIWSKNYPAYQFTKKSIAEFKGSNSSSVKYPYQNFVHNYSSNSLAVFKSRLNKDDLLPDTQINQKIINGIPFFDYAKNYVEMYKLLFEEDGSHEELVFFSSFFKEYCIPLKKKGDIYLLELYKSILMLIFDKFGVIGLKKHYLLVYAYVFRFRLEKKFVRYKSVAQFPAYVIAELHHAKEILELNFLKEYAFRPIKRQANSKNNEVVESFFRNHFSLS
ncbi:MAG TPA: DUF262 domain-containing protein [Emticicia sp.]